MSHCECGTLHHGAARRAGCQECGTACCRTCAVEVDASTYCRWCAPGLVPATAA